MPRMRQWARHIALMACVLPLGLPLGACDDEVDPLETAEQISQESGDINIALIQGDPLTLPIEPAQRRLLTQSATLPAGCSIDACDEDGCVEGDWSLGCVSVSPVAVPVEFGAYDSPIDDRVSVTVEIADRYAGQVDYAELVVTLGGDEETQDSKILERDALDSTRFYTHLKPSCDAELRDSNGVCILDEAVACDLDATALASWDSADQSASTLVRCDQFSVRLWRENVAEDETATPTAAN